MLPGEPVLERKGIAVALAEGVGASQFGHIASAAAVRCFLDDYYAISDTWSVRQAAQRVLAATNAWLHAQTRRGAGRFDHDSGYRCSFSALILKDREAHLLQVGHARAYRLQAWGLEPLGEDHGARTGDAVPALGVQAHVDMDYRRWPLEVGEVYLLVSGGAHACLDAAAVQRALQDSCHGQADDLDEAAQALADLAQARGGEDDITVQLLRVDALPAHHAPHWAQARQHLILPPALTPGRDFEGYAVQRALHLGARSHVYLAVEEATDRRLVIKTPVADPGADGPGLDRFAYEEWVARRIDSPHVLKAHDRDDADRRRHLYVALEYVDGQTLAQWMVDHPRPALDGVRALVEQLARALEALHRRGMLHQDLRPDHAMVDRQGTVRLIGLGAIHVPGVHAPPRAQAPQGMLQYAAPECFSGGPADARTDLFALAAITYQMLSGQLPYGLEVARLRNAADLGRLRYVPLRQHRSDLPEWLDGVLRKALSPVPGQRQPSVAQFAHDLRRPGPGFEPGATPARPGRLPPQLQLRLWQTATAVLTLAVVVMGCLLQAH
jgi:serine/threonine protein phosphatase PrpC